MFDAFWKLLSPTKLITIKGKYDDLFEHNAEDTLDQSTKRWPPFVLGIAYLDTHTIMKTQSMLIQDVQRTLRFNQSQFKALVMPCIENYAEFVSMLPASEAHHHRGEGGLFRHGLEVGLWAAKIADSHQFCRGDTPEVRRANEPRWQLAAFLGGLMHDIGKPLTDVAITDKNGNIEWEPYAAPLSVWLVENKIDRFYLRWRPQRHRRHEKHTSMFIPAIVPKETRSFLNRSDIYSAFADAIVGTSLEEPLAKIVMQADQESVRRDLTEQQMDIDGFSYGVPVEKFIFDALRVYVDVNPPNQPGALVWNDEISVYVNWYKIVPVLLVHFAKQKIPGIPRDPDTLADILLERNFAVPFAIEEEKATARYWRIYPELIHGIPLNCLRFDKMELIYKSVIPAPAVINLHPPKQDANEVNVAEQNDHVHLKGPESSLAPGINKTQVSPPTTLAEKIPHPTIVDTKFHQYSNSSQIQKRPESAEAEEYLVAWAEDDDSQQAFYEYENAGNLTSEPPTSFRAAEATFSGHEKTVEEQPLEIHAAQDVKNNTPAVIILKKAIGIYLKNKDALKEHRPGLWIIEHPTMTNLLGDSVASVMGALKAENMIAPDKVSNNTVSTIDGQIKCLVLSEKAKKIVIDELANAKAPVAEKTKSDTEIIKLITEQLYQECGSIIGDVVKKDDSTVVISKEVTGAGLKDLGVSSNAARMVIIEKVPGYCGEIFEGNVKHFKFRVEQGL